MFVELKKKALPARGRATLYKSYAYGMQIHKSAATMNSRQTTKAKNTPMQPMSAARSLSS